jgi:hypothetical protein
MRHLHYAVLVAHLVFRFGAKIGKKFGVEVTPLLLVQLFEIRHPLVIHLVFSCGSCGEAG